MHASGQVVSIEQHETQIKRVQLAKHLTWFMLMRSIQQQLTKQNYSYILCMAQEQTQRMRMNHSVGFTIKTFDFKEM